MHLTQLFREFGSRIAIRGGSPQPAVEPKIVAKAAIWVLRHWTLTGADPSSHESLEGSFMKLMSFLDENDYDGPTSSRVLVNDSPAQVPLTGQLSPNDTTQGSDELLQLSPISSNGAQDAAVSSAPGSSKPMLPDALDVEVWNQIFQYLSFNDMKNVRLTSQLMERYSSNYFFKSPVVPFSPKFYSVGDSSSSSTSGVQHDFSATDYGPPLQMFPRYAQHFRHFAISLDFDEEQLALPLRLLSNTCITQLPVWFQCGETRWPDTARCQYDFVQEREDLAEDTHGLKEAIALLVNMREFGLSLKSGYGWINGEDGSELAKLGRASPDVLSSWPQQREEFEPAVHLASNTLSTIHPQLSRYASEFASMMFMQYARILYRAGADTIYLNILQHYMLMYPVGSADFSEVSCREQIALMLTRYQVPAEHHHLLTSPDSFSDQTMKQLHNSICAARMPDTPEDISEPSEQFWTKAKKTEMSLRNYSRARRHEMTLSLAATRRRSYWQNRTTLPESFYVYGASGSFTEFAGRPRLDDSINPRYRGSTLTQNQMRMILEYEGVQRTLLTSLILAMFRNQAIFSNINKLRLVNISTCFIGDLNRKDLWDVMSGLTEVTFLVSPDWRHISSSGSTESPAYDDDRVRPTITSTRLSRLIEDQVAGRPIKKFTLGYVDGGEHATGIFARNRHVLPAPIFSQTCPVGETVTNFQKVEHLELVNCWATAKDLITLVKHKSSSLHTLTLDSFSLVAYGGSTAENNPWALMPHDDPLLQTATNSTFGIPAQTQAERQLFAQTIPLMNAENNVQLSTIANAFSTGFIFLSTSWIEVLANIAPAQNRLEKLDEWDPNRTAHYPDDDSPKKLQRLELRSCGYVQLGHQRLPDTFRYNGVNSWPTAVDLSAREQALRPHMMVDDDVYCGRIIQWQRAPERCVLEQAFKLRHGWGDGIFPKMPLEDGQLPGGSGRYSGVVTRDMVL